MRASLVLIFAAILAAGCAPSVPPAPASNWETNAAKSLDLSVKLELSKRFLHTGDSLDVRITVTNISDKPLTIMANSGALVDVKLYQTNAYSFEDEIKRYPRYAAAVMKTWTLAPGESRVFPMQLTVAPDWPMSEPLRLVAEVNGRPDVKPGIYIEVLPDTPKVTPKPVPVTKPVRIAAHPSASDTPVGKPVIIPAEVEDRPATAPATQPANSDESKAVEDLIKPNY